MANIFDLSLLDIKEFIGLGFSLKVIMLGLFVGLLSSILGLGGGVVMVPFLPIFTNLGQREAMAVSLATVALITAVNTYFFHKKGLVKWEKVTLIGGVAACSAYLAGNLSFFISVFHLKLILAILLGAFSIKTFLDKKIIKFAKEHPVRPENFKKIYSLWGFLSGAVSGFTGLGSGILVGPILLGFPWIKNDYIAPTTNAIMFITTPAALAAFLINDLHFPGLDHHLDMPWGVVIVLFISAFLSALLGQRFQSFLKTNPRRYILMACLAFLCVVESFALFS